jgi:lysozyme
MKCNEEGLDIIRHFEGLRLSVYRDPIGIPTVGYGSTRGFDGLHVSMDHRVITEEEARTLLYMEVNKVERAVMVLVDEPIGENQFSALVSWAYNVGTGNAQSSTLRQKLNRGDIEGAAAEFPKWRLAGGRILAGLVRRRVAERELFEL